MDKEIHLQYLVDQNTFKLKPITNAQPKLFEPLIISVTLPFSVSSIKDLKDVVFYINLEDLNASINSTKGEIISIKINNRLDWQRFLSKNISQFVGLITAILLSEGKEDFLWVERNDNKKIWILGVSWNGKYWESMLTECPRRKNLDRTFWCFRPGESISQKNTIGRRLFRHLTDKEGLGLPSSFPLFSDESIRHGPKTRQLTIKINPSEVWFLLFPIDYFCQFEEYGRFSFYREVEWILTPQKSFAQNIYERIQIQNELKNAKNFLDNSVIILNTYYYFENLPTIRNKWRTGTDLLKEILSLLQNIEIEGKVLSLRWYLNPLIDEIYSELLNSDTRYFFANFHTENGVWQNGGCERVSWKNSLLKPKKNAGEFLKNKDLTHIRLMRIFHCNSVLTFDEIDVRPSIGPLLLNAGALRVEGSIADGNYLDHCCSLLHFICHPKGLMPILIGKCWEKGRDYKDLIKKVNKFLKSNGWEKISNRNG